jgi:hypothetical protein
LKDQFKQSWHISIQNSPTTLIYKCFKKILAFEIYLEILDSKYLFKFLKFRTTNHKRHIESESESVNRRTDNTMAKTNSQPTPSDLSGARVTRSLILYVWFVDRYLSFCPVCFGHCVVCPSIYGFWFWFNMTFMVGSSKLEEFGSCSTCDARRVNLVTNPVIIHDWGKDRKVLTPSGTYPWSLLTQIVHSGQPSHGGLCKT